MSVIEKYVNTQPFYLTAQMCGIAEDIKCLSFTRNKRIVIIDFKINLGYLVAKC